MTQMHTQRWHAHRRSAGAGHSDQDRFKSFPVEADEHFLALCRDIERNTLRANLVLRAEEWRWSNLWRRGQRSASAVAFLSEWRVVRPRGDWPIGARAGDRRPVPTEKMSSVG